VKDTGIGIKAQNDKKYSAHLCRKTVRLVESLDWLGLAISNQLLELMDSKLNLESTYGTGSNFSLQLN
jgi:light-regulated signal transduction histidine kinase (bacteriophytochrome)